MLLSVVTEASSFPVSLAEAKLHLRVDHSDDDTLISALIEAACRQVGDMVGRSMVAETWSVSVAPFSGDLVLPLNPVTGVTDMSYFDAAGVSQSLTITDFWLFADQFRAALRPKTGVSWPTLQDRDDALTVEFTVGSAINPALRAAILLFLTALYETRDATPSAVMELSPAFTALINNQRARWVGA